MDVVKLGLLLITVGFYPGIALRDDWYSFSTFQDTSEWTESYKYTCDYTFDLFREPREVSERNDLIGPRELLSPIAFRSVDTVRSPENLTLHIYNNQASRKTHSVSYGFPRNKECLHGEDSQCVVSPELGRIRAVVITADRFINNQNLNFIKDHFLIERSEQFVTILNGGSVYERKFYEAVFLGGYPDNPKRSSHQIDGKTYPLEIYMYFLDETQPSVTLSTILVTLVKEVPKDNTQIKPIVNAVEGKLSTMERRFLQRQRAITRRERLFHHLKPSTYYDVYDFGNRNVKGELITHESLHSSVEHEAQSARYLEPFEKVQSLESQLFLLQEDLDNVRRTEKALAAEQLEVFKRKGTRWFPANNTEIQMMAIVTAVGGFINYQQLMNHNLDCDYVVNFYVLQGKYFKLQNIRDDYNYSKQFFPKGDHLVRFSKLVYRICEHWAELLHPYYFTNKDNDTMRYLSVEDKYSMIYRFQYERTVRQFGMNKAIYDHFNNNTVDHPYNPGDEKPEYANEQQARAIGDGIYAFMLSEVRRQGYVTLQRKLEQELNKVVDDLEFSNPTEMREVLRYLKHGSKTNDIKYHRSRVYRDYITRQQPNQVKKRSLVELGGMEVSEQDILDYERLQPISVKVDQAFQISWLIPQSGGYYHYKGSSPVPPCFRAQNVIVFKKPLKMSRRQIEVLTRVPRSFYPEDDTKSTTPIAHDTRFEVNLMGEYTEQSRLEEVRVTVYHQPRNHLFLGHDGVHRNSVDEWEKLKAKLNAQKNTADKRIKPCQGLVFILISLVMFITFLN